MLLPHIPEKLLKRDKNQFGRYCTAFSSWRGALLSLSVYLSVCLSSLYQHLSFYLSFLSLAPWSRPNPLLFLLISPRVFFHFYFRLQFPSFYSTNFRFLLIFREFWRSWKDFFFFLDSRTLRLRHTFYRLLITLWCERNTQKANCESWPESRDELW